MAEIYVLNPQTGILHIVGGCHHSNNPGYKHFDSLQEAFTFEGRAVRFCRFCEKIGSDALKNIQKKKGNA